MKTTLQNFAYFHDIAINMEQVSTVKISEHRIVFSYNYTVKKSGNTIPDSFYVKDYTPEELNFTNSEYFKDNFIEYSDGKYLNKNSIASMRYNSAKGVIIFNMTHLHTYSRQVVSDSSMDVDCEVMSEKIDMPEYAYMKASYEDYLQMLGV